VIVVPIIFVPFIVAAGIIIKIVDARQKANEKKRLAQRNAELQNTTTEDW
jgi:hypothetical protein